VGQPELLALIDRSEMRQLRQRVAINCRLEFLAKEEIDGYITRRLFIAGDQGRIRFTPKAISLIAKASKGIPRLINKICDFALTAGYIADDFVIKPEYIKKALKELGDLDFNQHPASPIKPGGMKFRGKKSTYALAACIVVFLLVLFSGELLNFGIFGKKIEIITSSDQGTSQPNVRKAIPGLDEPVLEPSKEIPEEAGPAAGTQTKEDPVVANSRPSPYILLLGSFRTLLNTKESAAFYKKKGIDAHWNYVDLEVEGIWYRLFTGGFTTVGEAKQYKKENGLEDSIIISAPWTVFVGQSNSIEDLDEVQSVLKDNQYDYYSEKCEDGSFRLLMGAFKTREGAERLAQEVAKLNLVTEVALR
jgi:cell division septation protein DedD